MKKWLKEPLMHFLCIGALIFIVFSVINEEEISTDGKKIVVSAGDIERLSANWSKKWNRPPTGVELKGLVDSYIKEEVYYREALALGLNAESALNQYFLQNQEKYIVPARASFTHIYFSLDKRGAKVLTDSKKVLSELNIPRAPERGDSFMLEYDFTLETPFWYTA